MTTFTWTTAGGNWETPGSWGTTPAGGHPTTGPTGSFITNPGDDYVINTVVFIGNVGAGSSADTANTITLNAAAQLTIQGAGNAIQELDVQTGVTLNAGVLALNPLGGASLFLSSGSGSGSTLFIGAGASVTGGGGDFIEHDLGSTTQITGTGSLVAQSGLLDIGPSVLVTGNIQMTIGNTGTLAFEDAVSSGTVSFTGLNGLLDLLAPGSFKPIVIKGLTLGGGTAIDINDGAASISSATLTSVTTSGAILHVVDSVGTYNFTLSGNYTGASSNAGVVADAANGGFDVFLVCYGAGTAILTENGEVPVETIHAGDTVTALVDGALVSRTVTWAGYRDLDLTRHPKPETVAPIRILRGALGENLPRRDLLVSPSHCLFIDGGLYPAKLLVNGRTIVRDRTMTSVSYHHIELEQHGVLIAEGVAAESYLDTGNRAFFANGGLAMVLHPELTINETLRCWEDDACAPLMVKPDAVRPIWQRFADRAEALGFAAQTVTTTLDADLHLMAGDVVVRPVAIKGQTVTFAVPAGADSLRLMSRATAPDLLTPWVDDQRNLGVAVRSIILRGAKQEMVLSADHPALRDGWFAVESDADGSVWRWTNGDAALPVITSGAHLVEVTLNDSTTYIRDGERLAA